jgi:hypothetical protein
MAQSRAVNLSAPSGGWNARDSLATMKPNQAVVLVNLIPGDQGAEMRFGCQEHSSGIGARINTLMPYSAPSGANKLFAASGADIYDVTAEAVVDPGVSDVDGLGSDVFSHTNFGNPGGNYLICCNGVDPVQSYDGSAWSEPSIANVNSSDLIFVTQHANRIWFIEKQSLSGWYLEVDAVMGAATEFSIAGIVNHGGSLVSLASWTRDGGDGSDDVLCFITDKGEVVIFSGTDPDTAETWQKVGLFKIAPPIGKRCVIKLGADLAILTSQGTLPLSSILSAAASQGGKLAVTNTIEGAFNKAYLGAGSVAGWQIVEYPRRRLMFVNVPMSDGETFEQYVMNVNTGAWTKFKNWNATCWALSAEEAHFATTDGRVMKLTDGYTDDGEPIEVDCLMAFSDYGTPAKKQFLQVTPLITALQGTDTPFEMKIDYDLSPSSLTQSQIPSSGTEWGSEWGSSWGAPIVSVAYPQSVLGFGRVGAPRLKLSSRTALIWHQTVVMYEVGGLY